jgi:hypothetical protein
MDEKDQIAWDQKAHADCPGRVVLKGSHGISFACSQGKLHKKPVPKKSAAEQKREAEQKARRDAYKPACEAATIVRRRHVREALAATGPDHTARARQLLVDGILEPHEYASPKEVRGHYALLADLTGADLATVEDAAQQRGLLETALARLSLEGLVFLADIAANYKIAELEMAKTPGDGVYWHGYRSRDWVQTLDEVYGYEWSDWERETFKVDEVLAPADSTASDEDEGGDDQ